MPDRLLNTDETVKLLNISRPTLYEWMDKGILKPVDMYPSQFKRRPRLWFREDDVKQLMPAEHVETPEDDEKPAGRNRNKPAA